MIRFADCDPAGIVFTPRFVEMLNGVIEDFFGAALGLNYHALIRDDRIGLGYASVACDFFLPGLMGDVMIFTPLVTRTGRSSIDFCIHGHRGAEEILRAHFVMVTTDLDTHRAISIPTALRTAIIAYQDICR